VWASLSHIGELNRGKSKHRPRNDPKLYNGDYPFVQTGDIRYANKFISNYSQTYNEIGLKQSRLWPKGTLCITIAANIADTAILNFDACFPDSIVGFIPNIASNIFFIEYFLRTAKENLERYAPATAQKNINLKILSELLIPLPPRIEQDKIVSELDRIFSVIDKLDSIIDIELRRSQFLRQSILKRAFEGKLVPQDPHDLPAPRPGKYFIYVLECSNGSYYIGNTENIEKRWINHAGGGCADWTRKYPPVALVHWEEYNTRVAAAKREKELKTGFGRKWIKREIKEGRTRQAGEPASVLLEIIKSEKAKSKKSKQMEIQ
jgi:predicted GIY-YIG superfamily endonuclease